MPLNYIKNRIVLLYLLIFTIPIFSQSYQIVNYTEEEGLSASHVYSIIKDKNGKIWFSTERGLTQYNGFEWNHFNDEKINNSKGIRLFHNNGNDSWGFSSVDNSFELYFLENNEWKLFSEYELEFSGVNVTSFDLKNNNNKIEFLVGTKNDGLFYFRNGKWSHILDSRVGKNINFIKSDKNNFYVCSSNGIFALNNGHIDYGLDKKIKRPENEVYGIILNHSKYILLGKKGIYESSETIFKVLKSFDKETIYNSGITQFDKIDNDFYLYKNHSGIFLVNVNKDEILNLNTIEGVLATNSYSYFLDEENNIWISTYFGVSKITSLRFENYQPQKNKFKQQVPSLVELNDNKIVFSCDKKLFLLDKKLGNIIEIVPEISENNIDILSLAKTSDNKLVIAGQQLGVGILEIGKKVKWYDQIPNVARIIVDTKNNIWFSDYNSLYKFGKKKSLKIEYLPSSEIRNLIISPNDDIFLATGQDGVFRLNDGAITQRYFSRSNKQFNNTYNVFFNDDTIMVGSKAGPLVTEGDSLVAYKDGVLLKNRPVFFIQKDFDNRLWFGTDYGIYSWKNNDLTNFTTQQGLLGLETYRSGSIVDDEGNLWLGTDRGLSKYQANLDFEIAKPRVIIDSIKIKDLFYVDDKNIELNHSYNDIEVYFRSSSYIKEKLNVYKVYLEGYDQEWSKEIPISQHIVRYLNIPPGEYKLHLKVKNSNGDWSDEYATSNITILSPFYTSWKFVMILVIIAGMLLVLITRYVINFRYTANLEDEIIKRTKELEESRKRYFQMFDDNIAIAILIDPANGKILNANKSALNYYNYTLEEFRRLNYKSIDHLYQNEYYPNLLDNSSGNQNYYETQHRVGSGELKEVEVYFSFINVEGKNLIYAIVHDISSKKIAEKNLIESEEKYRALINNMQDGVFVLKDLRFSFVNSAFALMVGYRSKELIGLTPKKLIAREDFSKVVKKYVLIARGEKISEEHEFKLIHRASGNFVYVNVTFSVINYQGNYALLGTVKNITIRKRQEEQLRKLSTAVEQSPTGIVITNLDGNIEYVNPRFSEITGYSFHEVVKKKPSILNSGAMDQSIFENLWKTIKSGNIWRGELCNKKKNGELYWISCAIAPIKNETGILSHFIAVQTDITFQKFAQAKIETQQQQLSSILNNMPLILFALSAENKFTFVRGKGLTLFNISNSELVGRPLELIFKDYPEIIDDYYSTVAGRNQNRLIRQLREYHFEIHLIPIFDSDGEFSGVNGIAYDITQRFNTQQALKDSEERFRSLYENSSVGIYRSTKNGYILMANPTLVKMMGYNSIEELSKHNLEDNEFNVKYDRSEFVKRIEDEGVVKGLETIWLRSDKQIIYVRESARKIVNYDGRTLYYDGVIEDITEMKLAEQELVKSEARNRAMLHAIPDIMFELTDEGSVLAAHIKEADANILGLPNLLLGTNIYDQLNDYLSEKTKYCISKVIQTRTIESFEFTVKNVDKVHYFESRFISAGNCSVIVMLRDITDRKEGEKMLIRAKNEAEKSDKLKSEFLAQMSHEIRTPINSILSFTSLIKEEMINKVDDDFKIYFDVIDNGGHRLIRTIDSILNMSQLQSGTYQPIYSDIDIDKDILRTALAELKQRANEKNLELTYKKETNDFITRADSYTVGQIFINLIDNAIKYTEAGSVNVSINRDENHKLVVIIEDTGIGMSKEYIPNLFKPFTQEESGYTRRYEGNGLGLALVKNYIDINRAMITVESEKGVGTKFIVKFN